MCSHIKFANMAPAVSLSLLRAESLFSAERRQGQDRLSCVFIGVLIGCFFLIPHVARAQSVQDQIVEHFRAGQQAISQGDFSNAAQEFKKVLALDPNLVEAEVNLGLAYQSLGEYRLAVQHLTTALRQRPNLLAPNVIAGMDYVKLGSPAKAVPYLQTALKIDPSNREAHQALASLYISQENFHGAAQQYRELAQLDPDKAEAWFKLGHEYLDLAARLAYRGARLYRDSAWGHRFLGDLLLERGRWDDAEREYEKALNVEAHQEGLHSSIGQAYLHAGQLDKAEAEFQTELQQNKTSVDAWLGLAEAKLAQNQSAAALDSVSKAWEIAPEFVALQREFPGVSIAPEAAKKLILDLDSASETPPKHFLLAALYAAAGDGARADDEWKIFQTTAMTAQQSAHAIKADACQVHRYSTCIRLLRARKVLSNPQRLTLAKSEFAMRQYELVEKSLAEMRDASTQNAEASYWLSRTYQALGADAYTQLQEGFPDSWRTHQLRGEGDALKGDYDTATKEFQAALQMKPDSAELHEALGELYVDNHSEADGEKELKMAIAIDPSRSRALYLLGRLYIQQRDNEKAVPFLQRALRLEPDFAEASSLLGTALMRLGRYSDAVPNLENAAQVDHYGNIHYQLFVAYKKLGQNDLAQKALARSQDIRRSSLEHDQAIIMGAPQVDAETQ